MPYAVTKNEAGHINGVYLRESPFCPPDAVDITDAEYAAIRAERGGFPMFDMAPGGRVTRSARQFVRPDPQPAPPAPPSELDDLRTVVADILQAQTLTTPAARAAADRLKLKVSE